MSPEGSLDVFDLVRWLEAQKAHHDVVSWVKARKLGWPEAWDVCPRGDWLLAFAVRAGTDRERLADAVIALAESVMEDVDVPGLADALATLRAARADGAAADALADAEETRASSAPDLLSAQAHRVVALAARSLEEPETAALVPAQMVELAMSSVIDCAMMSVVGATHARTADIVRAHLPAPRLSA